MNGLHLKDRRRRGQAVVLVALMAVALVAFVGLALDGAQVFERRRMMQNAADAGAMAGAYGLGNGMARSTIEGQVQSYTVGGGQIGNRADNWEGVFLPSNSNVRTTNPDASDNCVRVTTYVTFGTYFIGVVGFNAMNTSAQATACAGPIVSSGSPMWPMLVHTPSITQPWTYGQNIKLFNDDRTDFQSGTFGWADLNGGSNGSGELIDALKSPYGGPFGIYGNVPLGSNCSTGTGMYTQTLVYIGDCLGGGPGMSPAGPKVDPNDPKDMAKCASKNWDSVECAIAYHINMSVTVLIYDNSVGQGDTSRYHVVNFARFTVTGFDFTGEGKNKYVTGYFQRYILPGEICLSNCGGSTGVKGVNLTN